MTHCYFPNDYYAYKLVRAALQNETFCHLWKGLIKYTFT